MVELISLTKGFSANSAYKKSNNKTGHACISLLPHSQVMNNKTGHACISLLPHSQVMTVIWQVRNNKTGHACIS